jgi:hypothetical protein
LATSSDEINRLTSLQDLVSEVVGEKCWDHNIVKFVLLSP